MEIHPWTVFSHSKNSMKLCDHTGNRASRLRKQIIQSLRLHRKGFFFRLLGTTVSQPFVQRVPGALPLGQNRFRAHRCFRIFRHIAKSAIDFLHRECRNHAILIGQDNVNMGKHESSDQSAFKPLLFSSELLDLLMGRPPFRPHYQSWTSTVTATVDDMKPFIRTPNLARQPRRRRGKLRRVTIGKVLLLSELAMSRVPYNFVMVTKTVH